MTVYRLAECPLTGSNADLADLTTAHLVDPTTINAATWTCKPSEESGQPKTPDH
jgi:hypothetical protein